jgi:acetoacetate decarboxylase
MIENFLELASYDAVAMTMLFVLKFLLVISIFLIMIKSVTKETKISRCLLITFITIVGSYAYTQYINDQDLISQDYLVLINMPKSSCTDKLNYTEDKLIKVRDYNHYRICMREKKIAIENIYRNEKDHREFKHNRRFISRPEQLIISKKIHPLVKERLINKGEL